MREKARDQEPREASMDHDIIYSIMDQCTAVGNGCHMYVFVLRVASMVYVRMTNCNKEISGCSD